ncbi:PAS domain S-box protein [Lyngbya aestuarii]|uniref:PAS domain S-box protein n=1 Tax=Lyngbya aestuarii TaxID=118322 RepID=UPI00403DE290
MARTHLSGDIQALQERLEAIQQSAQDSSIQPEELLAEAINELSLALEKLRQQKQKLIATRPELARKSQHYQDSFKEVPQPDRITKEEQTRDSQDTFEQLQREIIKRKLAIVALQESEERFRAIFEQAAVGIAQTTPSGQPLRYNQRFCEIVGYTESELLDYAFINITHPDVREAEAELINKLLVGEISTYSLEKAYVRKEAQLQWVNVSVSLVRDSSGTPQYFIAVVEDIQERKQAEAALRESEERLRVIFEQAAVGIARVAPSGRFLQVNQRYCDLAGYTKSEMLERTFQDITYPDDLESDLEQMHQLCAGEISTFSMEKRFIRKDGQLQWTNLTVSLVRDSVGVPQYTIGVVEDIQERKRAEEQLQATQERYRIVSELISDYAYSLRLSPNGKAKADWTTDALSRISGFTLEEVEQDLGWQKLIHPDDLPIAWRRAQALLSGQSDISEYRIITKSGEVRWLRDYGCPIEEDGVGGASSIPSESQSQRLIYGAAQDITQQKRVQEQLRYRLVLETALAQVSRKLATSEAVDLNQVLEILGVAVGANSAHLLQFSASKALGENFYRWCEPQTLATNLEDWCNLDKYSFPWLWSKLNNNHNIVISDVEELPLAAQAEKNWLKELNVCSTLIVPIYQQSGQVWGTIGLDNTGENRKDWLQEDAQLLRVVGEIIYSYCDRLQAQAELRASEALYAGIFNHSAESIFLVDVLPDGQFVYETMNPAQEKATGISAAELAGKTPQEVLPPDIAIHVEKRYRACITTGTPLTYEETLELPIGTRMWRTTLVPIRDLQGRIVKLQGGSRDITEEKQATARQIRQTRYRHLLTSVTLKIRQSLQIEEILQTTVVELQKTLQTDRVLFFRLLPDGSGKVVNEVVLPEFTAMLGMIIQDECLPERYLEKYRKGRIHVCDHVISAGFTPCYLEFMQQHQIQANLIVPILLNTSETESIAIAKQGKEGKISDHLRQGLININQQPQIPNQLWGLLCVQQCSTIRQWTSFEIELMQQLAYQLSIALYQAQLLEQETRRRQELARSNAELEQFAYVASHDLQEPLQTIASYAKLLERRYYDKIDAKANKFIHYIVDGSIRMQRLINDLLEYSRVGRKPHIFEITDCNLVLEEVIANLQQTIIKNQVVVTKSHLPRLIADSSQLVPLFQNLIGNAIKYRSLEPPLVEISAKLQDDVWLFSVRDNGIGIAPKHAERIFLIFQRLHTQEEYPGTGIGLAICQKIMERHGGRIWVESEASKGSTFYLAFPVQDLDV